MSRMGGHNRGESVDRDETEGVGSKGWAEANKGVEGDKRGVEIAVETSRG